MAKQIRSPETPELLHPVRTFFRFLKFLVPYWDKVLFVIGAIVIAGWTTANPTLYRAGMALQVASGWSRWKVTLLAGAITTVAAMFPALVMKLLDFVALYGLILIPMGAVILADFYFIPRLGLQQYYAEKKRINFNMAAAATWFIMLALALFINLYFRIELYFLPGPVWVISLGVYLLFSHMFQKQIITAS